MASECQNSALWIYLIYGTFNYMFAYQIWINILRIQDINDKLNGLLTLLYHYVIRR